MKFLLLVLCAVSILKIVSCKTQQKSGYIVWRNDRKLSWNDFKKPVDGTEALGAASYINMHFDFKIIDETGYLQRFSVTTLFSQVKSWYNVELNYVLRHEQEHFNIGEVVARKFRQRLFSFKNKKEPVTKNKLSDLYSEYTEMLIRMQDQYDSETEYGLNRDNQRRWSEKIAAELQALSEFTNKRY